MALPQIVWAFLVFHVFPVCHVFHSVCYHGIPATPTDISQCGWTLWLCSQSEKVDTCKNILAQNDVVLEENNGVEKLQWWWMGWIYWWVGWWMDRRMDKWIDWWIDGWIDWWKDTCMHMKMANERKRTKYEPLEDQCRRRRWECQVLPIEVGCRGFGACSTMFFLRGIGLNRTQQRKTIRALEDVAETACSWIWQAARPMER